MTSGVRASSKDFNLDRKSVLILILAICWLFPHDSHATDTEADVRRDIETAYARVADAFERHDMAPIQDLYADDYRELAISGEERDRDGALTAIKAGLSAVTDVKCRVSVESIAIEGSSVTTVVRWYQSYAVSTMGQAQHFRDESLAHDTWIKFGSRWRLRRSEYHETKLWRDDQLVAIQTLTPPLTPEQRTDVVRDLKSFAHPFRTEIADQDFDDLEFLDKLIGDARIVSLGEASHGTAEFFRMKHRILEYLVQRKGFTVFAIEANWPEAELVDRFIKTGDGSAAAGLAAMGFWTWNTEEVRDMVNAMRAYNVRRGQRPILSFAGFDMQSSKVAVERVIAYVARFNEAEADQVRAFYAGTDRLGDPQSGLTAEDKLRLKDNAAKVLDMIDARSAALLAISTPEEYRDARQAARVVLQACEMFAGQIFIVRDRAMADNVQWLIETRFPGEKIVLWAHNGHVGTSTMGEHKSQGTYLRERYGAQMVVLGFASYQGEVRALRIVDGAMQRPPIALPLHAPPPQSLESVFQSTGMSRFILDFRVVPKDSALGRWLGLSRMHRSIGAAFNPEGDNFEKTVMPSTYDGIIYISQSTAAKPLQ